MRYRAILLDLDNTLYDYDEAHQIALREVIARVERDGWWDRDALLQLYRNVEKNSKQILDGRSGSHCLLHFKSMMGELCQMDRVVRDMDFDYRCFHRFSYILELNDLYSECLLEHVTLFEGVIRFLDQNRLPIVVVSNHSLQDQMKKIVRLGVEKYLDLIVTSEEAGSEKPFPEPYLLALSRLKLQPKDCIKIGSNYATDCVGASKIGMDSIWFNRSGHSRQLQSSPLIVELTNFAEIRSFFDRNRMVG